MENQVKLSEEQIKEIIWGVVEDFLIPRFKELNMNASGQWLDALSVNVDGQSGEIWGMDYTYYLVNGRRPGKQPPISVLERWVNDKFGIGGNEAKSMAFAIAKKIAKEGTDYYPNGTNLLDVLSSGECIDYINRIAGEVYLKSLSLNILRQLKNIR